MANKKNKVKFGLTNVHYAKIKDWVTDASGANLTPVYVDPVRLPGAVSISIDANCDTSSSFRSTKTPLLSRISPRISVEKSVGIRAISKSPS